MKIITSIILGGIAILGGIYIAIWWGIIQPMLNIAEMLDNNTLTATTVVWEILKFMFKELFAFIWVTVFLALAGININR